MLLSRLEQRKQLECWNPRNAQRWWSGLKGLLGVAVRGVIYLDLATNENDIKMSNECSMNYNIVWFATTEPA